jgi:hypothetical protein
MDGCSVEGERKKKRFWNWKCYNWERFSLAHTDSSICLEERGEQQFSVVWQFRRKLFGNSNSQQRLEKKSIWKWNFFVKFSSTARSCVVLSRENFRSILCVLTNTLLAHGGWLGSALKRRDRWDSSLSAQTPATVTRLCVTFFTRALHRLSLLSLPERELCGFWFAS